MFMQLQGVPSCKCMIMSYFDFRAFWCHDQDSFLMVKVLMLYFQVVTFGLCHMQY